MRLLYLILDRCLSWLMLLGRTSSTKDVDLLVLVHRGPDYRRTRRSRRRGPTATGQWRNSRQARCRTSR